MSAHTEGRIEAVDVNGFGDMGLVVNGRDSILTVDREGFGYVAEPADARRMAACWNAFEGVSTEDIEMWAEPGAGGVRAVIAKNDQLRADIAAARALLAEILPGGSHSIITADLQRHICALLEAIP